MTWRFDEALNEARELIRPHGPYSIESWTTVRLTGPLRDHPELRRLVAEAGP